MFVCSCVLLAAGSTSDRAASRRRFRLTKRSKPAPAQIAPIVDAFFESYLGWLQACEDLRTAYDIWDSCAPPERILAFSRYSAALEREERAARVHSDLAERLSAGAGLPHPT